MSSSPYAPPLAAVNDPAAGSSEVEAIRREHLAHERQLKSVGILYYFAGTMVVIGFMAFFIAWVLPAPGNTKTPPGIFAITVLYFVLGVLSLVLGYGFRRLKPWVTVPATILSALGLLAFPVGTLINARILYLIYCKKGRIVLAHGYSDVIAATPHMKYRLTAGDWIALGFLGLLVLGLVFLFGSLALRH
jgi:hypothetical protein